MATATQQQITRELAPILPVAAPLATPQILRIDRYSLKAGTETAVRNLQRQVALAMARWDGPHPCVGIESLTGPKEVWRLSGFQSADEHRKAAESLERNEALRTALQRIEDQTRVLIGSPATVLATYCGGGHKWLLGRGRFLVIAVSHTHTGGEGAVYETGAGVRYRIAATRTRRTAAAAAGPEANSFAIRPTWGMPALAWTRTDRVFWKSSPVVKRWTAPLPGLRTGLESVEVQS